LISIPSVDDRGEINIDDIALFERRLIGNTVAYDFIKGKDSLVRDLDYPDESKTG